ncbi:MAG: substrate binding domain-containing protein [Gammaproteobacteria bacterium]
MLAAVEEAEHFVTQLSSEPRGTLRVTAPPSFGTFHLTPAIADYETIYTDVYVYLALNDGLVDLLGGGFDVGLKIGPLPDSRMIARKLAYTRLVVCGVPTYFEQHGIPRGIEDLARHNCLRDTQSRPKDEWLFKGPAGEFSLRVEGDFEASASDAVRMAALSRRGLAQLPTYLVGLDLKAGTLESVLRDYEPEPLLIHALYPDRRHLAATVRTFVEFLRARFHPSPYWERN